MDSLFMWSLRFWIVYSFTRILIRGLLNIFVLPSRGQKRTHSLERIIQILVIFALFGILTGSEGVSKDPHLLFIMGISWIILTLSSETLVFHFLFRVPVSEILTQYTPEKGYLNILVLLTMVIAPLFWVLLTG